MNLYIDESGSITTNNHRLNKYFVISCIQTNDYHRVIREFRNSKKKFLKNNPSCKLDIKKEIKGSEMPYGMKNEIFKNISKKTDAVFHFKIIDNQHLFDSLRSQSSLSFNYFISLFISSIYRHSNISNKEDLFMLIDERNQSVESLNSLEEYLRIKFTIEKNLFNKVRVKYKDSGGKDLIQLADVFANTLYRACNNSDDLKNRKLLKCTNVGINHYFPKKHNNLDICDPSYFSD